MDGPPCVYQAQTAGRATLFARPAALSLRLPAAYRRGKD